MIRLSSAGEKFPRCRLCGDFLEKHYDEQRKVFIFACRIDKWAIRADDVFLRPGAWERAEAELRQGEDTKEAFDCPHCRANMRFVCTSTGYQQYKCVKTAKRGCGMKVELKEPDRLTPEEVGRGVKDLVLDLTEEEKRRFS
jgi:hypothetical protein